MRGVPLRDVEERPLAQLRPRSRRRGPWSARGTRSSRPSRRRRRCADGRRAGGRGSGRERGREDGDGRRRPTEVEHGIPPSCRATSGPAKLAREHDVPAPGKDPGGEDNRRERRLAIDSSGRSGRRLTAPAPCDCVAAGWPTRSGTFFPRPFRRAFYEPVCASLPAAAFREAGLDSLEERSSKRRGSLVRVELLEGAQIVNLFALARDDPEERLWHQSLISEGLFVRRFTRLGGRCRATGRCSPPSRNRSSRDSAARPRAPPSAARRLRHAGRLAGRRRPGRGAHDMGAARRAARGAGAAAAPDHPERVALPAVVRGRRPATARDRAVGRRGRRPGHVSSPRSTCACSSR